MYLAGEDEVAGVGAEGSREPPPVLRTRAGSSPTLRLRFSVAYGPDETPPSRAVTAATTPDASSAGQVSRVSGPAGRSRAGLTEAALAAGPTEGVLAAGRRRRSGLG